MLHVRRLARTAGVLLAGLALGTQVVSAAPAAKTGTSYYTNGGVRVPSLGIIAAQMTIPPGKYHVTATVEIENRGPGGLPEDIWTGAAVNKFWCSMTAYGNTIGYAVTSLMEGGFASLTLDGVIDASNAPTASGTFIDVECRAEGDVDPLPYAGTQIVADSMTGIVDLRPH